jgi:hypothetical protein
MQPNEWKILKCDGNENILITNDFSCGKIRLYLDQCNNKLGLLGGSDDDVMLSGQMMVLQKLSDEEKWLNKHLILNIAILISTNDYEQQTNRIPVIFRTVPKLEKCRF